MASPASTATLAAESINGDPAMDFDEQATEHDVQEDEDAHRLHRHSQHEREYDFIRLERFKQPIYNASLSPLMLAARNPDPQILLDHLEEGQLRYYPTNLEHVQRRKRRNITLDHIPIDELWPSCVRYNRDAGITTPLLEAIRARLPENVQILLHVGADPNGPSLDIIESYSAFFLRFRPIVPTDNGGDVATRMQFLERMDLPQLSSLTSEEVEDRMWGGMVPFWCEQDFVPADFFRHGEAIPAIVEAARSGSIEIVNQLIEAGADTEFWKAPQFFVPADPTPSSLSVSSPIHAALQARDVDMLNHLLHLGFDPNTMPLSNPTRCFTPLMAVIIQHEDFQHLAFDALARRPNINFEIRTPIYGVHILHFAVAALNLEMLKHVSRYTPLRNAGTTALGHTLLHIACMPGNALEVQRHSQVIYNSIHETRDLHAHNDVFADCSPIDPLSHPNPSITNFEAQTAVVKFLWTNENIDLAAEDVHENTALHYLCSFRETNQELISWWKQDPNFHHVYEGSRNIHGATPEDLLTDNERIDSEGWKPWFENTESKSRAERKQAIWRELLSVVALRDF